MVRSHLVWMHCVTMRIEGHMHTILEPPIRPWAEFRPTVIQSHRAVIGEYVFDRLEGRPRREVLIEGEVFSSCI